MRKKESSKQYENQMTMNNEELKISTEGASPASSINAPEKPEKIHLDQVLSLLQRYFKDCSYDCGKNYTDGMNVDLTRDKLDPTTLLTCIIRIVFDQIRIQSDLTENRKIELSLILQSIEKQLQILRTDDKNVACVDVLCRIIGYCMKNYKIYK